MTTPLLIVGDAPSAISGLGRIARDLSIRIATHMSDRYEVATLGYGGFGDKSLPFMQYHIESMENWFIPSIRDVWYDFAGEQHGIIMTIWDASRLLWFARPDNPQYCSDQKIRHWLNSRQFKRWGYFPMDAVGPNGRLSIMQRETLLGYDKILAYSAWAERIVRNTITEETAEKTHVTNLPHGIDTSVFKPRDPQAARHIFKDQLHFNGPQFEDNEYLIGIVATNQTRKDWGLAIETIARVAKDTPIRLYIQCDTLERYWSLPALLHDYGLVPHSIINCNPVTDEQMSWVYSACDLTLGIGLGEGFGYPIFESLACGTPCLTGNYGGQAEHMSSDMLIQPTAWRLEGVYNCRRPVFDSEKWAYRIQKALRAGKTGKSLLPDALDWNNLWPRWEQWFKDDQIRPTVAQFPERRDSNTETDTEKSDQSTSTTEEAEVLNEQ